MGKEMPNKKNGLKKKNEMMSGYMGGGMMPKAPMNNMMPKAPMSQMFRGGGMVKDTTPSYKDMVQKMYGGGMTSPAMKKNK
jgi:hypothetical protein|tara:strand:+ start:438 stop:680 length:243 start_codon:yes stop_codon:yes gene_type:complete